MTDQDFDEASQHEAADRTHVIGETFARFVVKHSFVANDKALKALADKIEADLADLYQLIWNTGPTR